MSAKLPRSFYSRPALEVASDLLGKILVRRLGRRILTGMIVETEAYVGAHDLACHASKGHTPRTSVMFGRPGHAYVYMIYGFYYCLNVVTERLGNAPARRCDDGKSGSDHRSSCRHITPFGSKRGVPGKCSDRKR